MKHTVTEHKLASGAKGLIIDVPGAEVVNIVVRFNSGYQFSDQSKYEIPHVMEHLLATVSKKYPSPNAFAIEAQRLGAYANAHTSSEYNGYVYECAAFEFERILDLVEEQLVRPLFADKPLRAEIGNVREELSRNVTEHGKVCYIRLDEKAFPGRAKDYEARIAQLDQITVKDMEEHYRRTHTAQNARFYVSGSFGGNVEVLTARLEKIFSQLEAGERFALNQTKGLSVLKPVLTKRDIAQLYYAVAFYADGLEIEERPYLTLLRLVLAGGFQSRIKGELRERGLAYAFVMEASANSTSTEIGLSSYVTPKNAEPAFEVMARHLRAAADGELTEAELEAAKLLGIGSTKRSLQTPSDLLDWYIRPYESEERVLDIDTHLASITKASLRDVTSVTRKLLSNSKMGTSFVGDISATEANRLASNFKSVHE